MERVQDHHYSNEPIQVPSKAYMARVKKEYNVLASSLPRTPLSPAPPLSLTQF